MKEKIKEVQAYFKSKMLNGEFTITKMDQFTAELLIDGQFKFVIWTGNVDVPETRKTYDFAISFMDLELTDADAKKLDRFFKPEIKKFMVKGLLQSKRAELKKLESEILGFESKGND
jgi:hypothetical protein